MPVWSSGMFWSEKDGIREPQVRLPDESTNFELNQAISLWWYVWYLCYEAMLHIYFEHTFMFIDMRVTAIWVPAFTFLCCCDHYPVSLRGLHNDACSISSTILRLCAMPNTFSNAITHSPLAACCQKVEEKKRKEKKEKGKRKKDSKSYEDWACS